MQIQDRAESRPIFMNPSTVFVWEVIRYEWSDQAEDFVEKVAAVFYDPWKAVKYGTAHFGFGYIVRQSCRKI